MKEKWNKIVDIIGIIGICIIIVLLNLFIGSNLKEPIFVIEIVANFFAIIYLIIKKIISRENVIIKGKIDIAVICLVISTLIPLICETYTSLDGTCKFFIKYSTIFSLYLLIRNTITNEKRIKIIVNTVIISSLIPIVFGIDKITNNYFLDFLNKINAVYLKDSRFISTFGYKNTVAVFLSLNLFLSIGMFKCTKNKIIKCIYVIYCIIAIICIILAKSRMVNAILVLFLISTLIPKIFNKKIKVKTIIILGIILIISSCLIIVVLNNKKELEVIKTEKEELYLDRNSDYSIELLIDNENNNQTLTIQIIGVNEYTYQEIIEEIEVSNFHGKKTINFKTPEDIEYITVKFINNDEKSAIIYEMKINGKEHTLNYKYLPRGFSKLFTTFSFRTKSVWERVNFIEDGFKIIKSNWLLGAGGNAWRYSYLAEQDYLYYAKESHSYITELWISFGLLGILSFIAILILTFLNIKKLLYKKGKKEYDKLLYSIFLGVLLIILHSSVDFDMSFLIILMTVYMFIAILNNTDREFEKTKKISIEIILIFPIVLSAILSSVNYYAKNLPKDENRIERQAQLVKYDKDYFYAYIKDNIKYNKWYKEQYEYKGNNTAVQHFNKLIEEIKRYITQEKYSVQNEMYANYYIALIWLMENTNYKEQTQNLEFLYNTVKNIKISMKMEIEEVRQRSNLLLRIANKLSEDNQKWENKKIEQIVQNFYQLIIDEYSQNIDNIIDYKRNKLDKETVERIKNEYTENYEEALMKKNISIEKIQKML